MSMFTFLSGVDAYDGEIEDMVFYGRILWPSCSVWIVPGTFDANA